jgi:tRNA(fMet)-specific endonuclease VapC
MWMLGTDTCSYILRAHPAAVAARFKQSAPDEIGISSVVLAELYYGAALLPHRAALRRYIEQFAGGLLLLPWDSAAADHYGDIRAGLERKGASIGGMDLKIAAHARSRNAVLVTNNTKHFRRVPGLKLENWILR